MFNSIASMVKQTEEQHTSLSELITCAEMQLSDISREAVRQRMHQRLDVMKSSIQQGISKPVKSLSGISGGNAHHFWNWLQSGDRQPITGPLLSRAIARAMAVNEVNAGMGCIVATPTAGSAGILPAVLLTLQEAYQLDDERIVDGLIAAGGIGAVFVHRAHVAGAAGGCQAETGSAAAMAAAASVELLGGSPHQSAQAVAITLKNMLGLVCDPVAGLVEVPCVKRNAAGVAQCFVGVDLALSGIESVIPADEVIDAMASIGRRMDVSFRETALGGLAATPTGKRLTEKLKSDNLLITGQ